MEPTFSQPNGAPIERDLVRSILGGVVGDKTTTEDFDLVNYDQYSNDLAVATLRDGRRLVVKRGRHEWSRAALENSRRGANLLNDQGILAPLALVLPPEVEADPIQAYWRIELPTLMELWPGLNGVERERAIRSLGRLIRRAHAVQLSGDGLLVTDELGRRPIAAVLTEELRDALMPAVKETWPSAVPYVDTLLAMMPAVARRTPDEGLFQIQVEENWMPWFLEGYGQVVDPLVFRFYCLYHLVQLGLYSAALGHDVHAENVGMAASAEIESWKSVREVEEITMGVRRGPVAAGG